ncbi:MAG: sigma 54 modulation/S30EA ribosomal C-terminal domain-containing protein, partial [Streptosporangiaceae bacterium]
AAEDRFSALDIALARLESRLRRACDRRKDRYAGVSSASAIREEAASGPAVAASGPAVATSGPAAAASRFSPGGSAEVERTVTIETQGEGPLVVREKTHAASPMAIDQALFEMELIGHDFFLFADTGTGLPSVVYRRRGYQYGVIRLVAEPTASSAGLADSAVRQTVNLATG